MPAEVLRVCAQCLMEKGVTQAQIDRMTKDNPRFLLGIQ
jgi:predicted metal-dependent phosphotriesterase family hydrolase